MKAQESIRPVLLSICAALCYLLPSINKFLIPLLPLYFFFLIKIASLEKPSKVILYGLLTGFIISSVHLRFFVNIFSSGAVALWLVTGFWTSLFTIGIHFSCKRLNRYAAILFTGCWFFILEYISCELYPLKFSWNNIGYMMYDSELRKALCLTGVYGFSTILLVLTATAFSSKNQKSFLAVLCVILLIPQFMNFSSDYLENGPVITGLQMEFPDEDILFKKLDNLILTHPDTDIFMLSEYSFLEGIPPRAAEWCVKNSKYLIFGTIIKEETHSENTAVVLNPEGEIAHSQVKAVPIQFFNDGIPAKEQKVWDSPWGRIGICICYDLSYTKVIDNLIDQRANALIVPTMDVISWGKHQHWLHSRVAPVRAAEYGISIFKTASSGISQSIMPDGSVAEKAPYPGQGATLTDTLHITESKNSKPLDRYLFFPALGVVLILIIILISKRKKSDELISAYFL